MLKLKICRLFLSTLLIFLICCKGLVEPIPSINQKIAFVSYRDGNYEIYTMNYDGSDQLNLTKNPSADVDPVYSPDGSKIAFSSGRDGVSNIYIMNHDGSVQTNISNNSTSSYYPQFSPDGSQIVFVLDYGRDSMGNRRSDIYSMETDGTNQQNLTNNSSFNIKPQYSPDGSKIAFQSLRTGNFELFIMDTDGKNQKNLTDSISSVQNYQFSPDGYKIVFSTIQVGVSFDIYIMNLDGSNKVKLTHSIQSDFPIFSPDGAKVAFFAESDIFIMNSDGSNPINLSKNANWVDSPSQFSFDGSQILFISNRDPGATGGVMNTEIYIMDVDGTNQKNLSNNPSIDEHPVFQPQIR
jgi:Tol biopolymer transport system component